MVRLGGTRDFALRIEIAIAWMRLRCLQLRPSPRSPLADYPNGTPQAVVIGIPINADWTFSITGWVSDPNDKVAGLMRVLLVRKSFSFLWPAYQVEGVGWPANFFNDQTVVAMTTCDRNTRQMTYWLPGGKTTTDTTAGGAPAAPPAASPAAPAVPPAPAAPAASPAAPVTSGQATIKLTAFPNTGTTGPVSGVVTGLDAGQQYKAALFLTSEREGTWSKPQPGDSVPLGADGSFSFANWQASPNDVNWMSLTVQILPSTAQVATALGDPLPTAEQAGGASQWVRGVAGRVEAFVECTCAGVSTNPARDRLCSAMFHSSSVPSLLPASSVAAVATGTYSRGFLPGATAPAPSSAAAASPGAGAPAGGAATGLTIAITAFPAAGATTPISGKVTGLPAGAFKAVLYLGSQAEGAWIKPKPGTSTPVGADGTFSFTNWQTDPNDVNWQSLNVQIAPAASPIISVLGGPLPAPEITGAVATATYPKGYAAGGVVGPAPPAASAAAPAPGGAAVPRVDVVAPPVGSDAAVTGKVTGVTGSPADYKLGIVVSGDNGATWWDKTHNYPAGTPQAIVTGIPVNADGTFSIMGWANVRPNDPNSGTMRIVLVRKDFSFLWPAFQIEGIPWPVNFFNDKTLVAMTTVNRQTGEMVHVPTSAGTGTLPAASPAAPVPGASPAAPVPGTGGAAVTLVAPAAGTTDGLTGKVTGLTIAGHVGALYLGCNGVIWGAKPAAVSTFPINPDGTFSHFGWSSAPNDGACDQMTGALRGLRPPTLRCFLQRTSLRFHKRINSSHTHTHTLCCSARSPSVVPAVLIFPAGTQAVPVLGAAAIPNAVTSLAVAKATVTRPGTGTAPGGAPAPAPAPGTGTGGGGATAGTPLTGTGVYAEEIAWPPATAGTTIGRTNGKIAFSGYNWIVKDSGGGQVGPGNNIFDGSQQHIWVDNYGLHHTYAPTQGCNRWAATEVWLDHTLGYGSYLIRFVGTVNIHPQDVTWCECARSLEPLFSAGRFPLSCSRALIYHRLVTCFALRNPLLCSSLVSGGCHPPTRDVASSRTLPCPCICGVRPALRTRIPSLHCSFLWDDTGNNGNGFREVDIEIVSVL